MPPLTRSPYPPDCVYGTPEFLGCITTGRAIGIAVIAVLAAWHWWHWMKEGKEWRITAAMRKAWRLGIKGAGGRGRVIGVFSVVWAVAMIGVFMVLAIRG